MRKRNTDYNTDELVATIVDALQEIKGQQIVQIDLRELKNSLSDFFIVCQAESNTQVNALADNVQKQVYLKHNTHPHHIEGRENAQWILIDYFDVVVHVFQREYRDFYKIEDLWADGKAVFIAD